MSDDLLIESTEKLIINEHMLEELMSNYLSKDQDCRDWFLTTIIKLYKSRIIFPNIIYEALCKLLRNAEAMKSKDADIFSKITKFLGNLKDTFGKILH
jgi:hypothetical protein